MTNNYVVLQTVLSGSGLQGISSAALRPKREFIARDRSMEQIAKELGADRVMYQSIPDMVEAVNNSGGSAQEFCMACFEGHYPTGDITERMLSDIELDRTAASQV